MAARSTTLSKREKKWVGEPGGAWPVVGCQDRSLTCTCRCMDGNQRGGSWVFVDR